MMPEFDNTRMDPADPDATRATTRPRACPICGKPAAADEWPFCSRRCADVDLHRWLSGTYSVPAAPIDDGSDTGEPDRDD